MFWSGNYIAVRELNSLLKEEDVSLTQVLEADDILQECKADNKALIQFLTKPDVLAELITLITEEPPKDVELASQYRHASIACEVLTSQLSMLSDRLSLDTTQMNRLCDFISKDPPLNPLLASYFCKTVEMLLERSPKQDWYLYHIVCLRVLDFFKSRRDFLPNLLRHLATSAIADTFKVFIRLDDLFNKIVMEWLEEHQFLESLIHIICGTYEPVRADVTPPAPPPTAPAPSAPSAPTVPNAPADEQPEKAEQELSEKPQLNHNDEGNVRTIEGASTSPPPSGWGGGEAGAGARAVDRNRAVAAANAAGLLCDLVLNGCAQEGCITRVRTVWALVARLQEERWVRALLGAVFTAPPHTASQALHHAAHVLLALLSTHPVLDGSSTSERTSVELAVAPHLPLLHQALLKDPDRNEECRQGNVQKSSRVGWARVQVAALLAELALSQQVDVPTTMLALGTPGTLVDLMFAHPENNFLHAQVYAIVKNALSNTTYKTMYANHLLVECDLLTRLMDVFEENENKERGPRAGYMGHVVLLLRRVWRALDEDDGALAGSVGLPPQLLQRFTAFLDDSLKPLLQRHDTPLGGYYPSDNVYEVENMGDSMEATYEFNDMVGGNLDELGDDIDINAGNEFNDMVGGNMDEMGDDMGLNLGNDLVVNAAKRFMDLARQRFDEDMWEDTPGGEGGEGGEGGMQDVHNMLTGGEHDALFSSFTAWESGSDDNVETTFGSDGWAHFESVTTAPPTDPFAPTHTTSPTLQCIPPTHHTGEQSDVKAIDTNPQLNIEDSMKNLKLSTSETEKPTEINSGHAPDRPAMFDKSPDKSDDKCQSDGIFTSISDDKCKSDGKSTSDDKCKSDGIFTSDDKCKSDGISTCDDKCKSDGKSTSDDKSKSDGISTSDASDSTEAKVADPKNNTTNPSDKPDLSSDSFDNSTVDNVTDIVNENIDTSSPLEDPCQNSDETQ